MLRHIIIPLIALLAAATPAAAQTTQKLTATKASEYGLIYRLPLTVADVTLEATCVTLTPGPLAKYAKIYLGQDPILEASTRWTLTSATLATHGEPDAEEEWLMQFKSGSAPYVIATADAMPLSVNTTRVMTVTAPAIPAERPAAPTPLEGAAARQAVTADMAAATSTAKKAELAAARIFEIRDTRSEILSGQSDNMPADGAAMQIVLDQLEAQEAALTAMFLGTRQEHTAVRSYTVALPAGGEAEEGTEERTIVARLSATQGFVAPDDLSGAPIYLNEKVLEVGQLPVNEKGVAKTFPKGGIAYCIPGRADLSVTCGQRTYATLTAPVAQLGVVFGLDPALFTDKKAPAYLIFDPATGAIRELGTTSAE